MQSDNDKAALAATMNEELTKSSFEFLDYLHRCAYWPHGLESFLHAEYCLNKLGLRFRIEPIENTRHEPKAEDAE